MNKTLILKMAKEDMITKISDLTLENAAEQKVKILQYLDFIERLIPLQGDDDQPIPSDTEVTYSSRSDNEHASDTEPEIEHETPEGKPLYLFERKIKGGFISEIQAYVPESVVRKLNLEEGDWLTAKPIPNLKGKAPKFQFDLVNKGDGKPPMDRIQLNYCLVEKNDNMFVSDYTMDNGKKRSIYIDDIPFTMLIRNDDVQDFSIKDGDVVDIAFNINSPEFNKVIWKHAVESHSSTPLISGYYKNKKSPDKIEINLEDEVLEGKKVLVIGCEPKKAQYREHIEKLGGEFIWAEGTEDRHRLEHMILKVDVVVLLISFIRHRASHLAVNVCKTNNVPFAVVDSLGVQSVIQGAQSAVLE